MSTERELAHRRNDGIDVRLLWNPATDRVTVAVDDSKTQTTFVIEVGPGEQPLDVFHHPFAYEAFHGIRQYDRIA